MSLAEELHSSSGVYVEAPAGHGKTYAIIESIAAYPESKQLILTHTVAGVAALRSGLKKAGISSEDVGVYTIAGWSQKYVRSYPQLAGVSADELDRISGTGEYWNVINAGFLKLLSKSHIVDIIKSNYEGVFVDEYQDCTTNQHDIVLRLGKLLPVRVLGDGLQAIFDFTGHMITWDVVENAFDYLNTLDTPYRWNNVGNTEYGEWLTEIRAALSNGESIDLSSAPSCVDVVLYSGDPIEDTKQVINKAKATLPGGDRRLIIGDKYNRASKELAKRLSRPRYTLIESLDSKEINELRKIAGRIDAEGGDKNLLLLEQVFACFTGTATLRATIESIRTNPGYTPQKPIYKAMKELSLNYDSETTLRIVKAIEDAESTSCHRRQIIAIIEMSLANWIAGSYDTLDESMASAIELIRQRGRKISRYSIGSTLLVKGLEVEEVMILEAQKLSRQDLYVAITRPTLKLTIFTNSIVLDPS